MTITAARCIPRTPAVSSKEEVKPQRAKGDGIVRIQRQTSGRKGKGVCLIAGIDLDDAALDKLAAELKKKWLRRLR